MTAQSKELGALAQKVAAETAEPIKSGMSKAFTRSLSRRSIALHASIA